CPAWLVVPLRQGARERLCLRPLRGREAQGERGIGGRVAPTCLALIVPQRPRAWRDLSAPRQELSSSASKVAVDTLRHQAAAQPLPSLPTGRLLPSFSFFPPFLSPLPSSGLFFAFFRCFLPHLTFLPSLLFRPFLRSSFRSPFLFFPASACPLSSLPL